MLTKDDQEQIQKLIEKPLAKLEEKIDNILLETKTIHKIIENQDQEFRERLELLEEHAGINPS